MSRASSRSSNEDTVWLNKGDTAIRDIHSLVKHAIRSYHKDWPLVFENLREAKDIARTLPVTFDSAGLVSTRLRNLTPGVRRTLARDMFGISKDESLKFLNDPSLPDIVILDFLDRSAACAELALRVDSENFKARSL